MNCILYAVYLPHIDKKYVLSEIFEYFKVKQRNAKIFIGIQYNSIPETEEILRKMKGALKIEMRRVPLEMIINSDASSFISALSLYKESNMNFDKCYFVHTKSITSNNDSLRSICFKEIFDDATIDEKFKDPQIGSYAPFLTITDEWKDIDFMSSLRMFTPRGFFTHTVMEYYYINTFFVVKNEVLKRFMDNVIPEFFTTHIFDYSDRYMVERDFEHIIDMQGYLPSFKYLHGNYSTNYKIPTMDKYEEKLNKWYKENSNET